MEGCSFPSFFKSLISLSQLRGKKRAETQLPRQFTQSLVARLPQKYMLVAPEPLLAKTGVGVFFNRISYPPSLLWCNIYFAETKTQKPIAEELQRNYRGITSELQRNYKRIILLNISCNPVSVCRKPISNVSDSLLVDT